jgi:hypothetical protein
VYNRCYDPISHENNRIKIRALVAQNLEGLVLKEIWKQLPEEIWIKFLNYIHIIVKIHHKNSVYKIVFVIMEPQNST